MEWNVYVLWQGMGVEATHPHPWRCECVHFRYVGLIPVTIRNIWLFPYHMATCGGAAFLIPYTLMLVLVALPVFFMELSLGQFVSLGCTQVWKVCPLFKGRSYSEELFACSWLCSDVEGAKAECQNKSQGKLLFDDDTRKPHMIFDICFFNEILNI